MATRFRAQNQRTIEAVKRELSRRAHSGCPAASIQALDRAAADFFLGKISILNVEECLKRVWKAEFQTPPALREVELERAAGTSTNPEESCLEYHAISVGDVGLFDSDSNGLFGSVETIVPEPAASLAALACWIGVDTPQRVPKTGPPGKDFWSPDETQHLVKLVFEKWKRFPEPGAFERGSWSGVVRQTVPRRNKAKVTQRWFRGVEPKWNRPGNRVDWDSEIAVLPMGQHATAYLNCLFESGPPALEPVTVKLKRSFGQVCSAKQLKAKVLKVDKFSEE